MNTDRGGTMYILEALADEAGTILYFIVVFGVCILLAVIYEEFK